MVPTSLRVLRPTGVVTTEERHPLLGALPIVLRGQRVTPDPRAIGNVKSSALPPQLLQVNRFWEGRTHAGGLLVLTRRGGRILTGAARVGDCPCSVREQPPTHADSDQERTSYWREILGSYRRVLVAVTASG